MMDDIFTGMMDMKNDPTQATKMSLYDVYRDDSPPGFFEKMGIVAGQETSIGQLSRYLSKPDYFPDPSFRVSDEMREKYGANISQESMQRIVDSDPVNFTEFLDEVRDVETTQKNRARIFEGGALGVAEGALATLLVSGGEAVAATMAATAGATG